MGFSSMLLSPSGGVGVVAPVAVLAPALGVALAAHLGPFGSILVPTLEPRRMGEGQTMAVQTLAAQVTEVAGPFMGFGLAPMPGAEAVGMGERDFMAVTAILLGMARVAILGLLALHSVRAEPVRSPMGSRLKGPSMAVAEDAMVGMILALMA